MNGEATGTDAKRKRRWQYLAVPLILLAVFPWLLANTPLRDLLLNAIVGSDDVRVQSRSASFGYLSPLTLDGLRISSSAKRAVIDVEQISSEHSWLGLALAGSDLGTFQFRDPAFEIEVDPAEKRPATPVGETTPRAPVELPQLVAEVRGAAITVNTPANEDPPIDVRNIDVTFRVEEVAGQSFLRVDATTIFDHQPLTPQLCGHGLQLVAPLLADELTADGEFSLRFDEVQIPLGVDNKGVADDLRISGELELHRASVALKNTAASRLVNLLASLLGRSMPAIVTVAEGVRVEFRVADGRVEHQGLAFVMPVGESSIQLTSSGSVGLDETLDLQVAVALPEALLSRSKLASRFANKPLVVAVGGTFDEPEIGLADNSQWIDAIGDLITGSSEAEGEGNLGEVLGDVVGELLQRAGDRNRRRSESTEEADDTMGDAAPLLPRLRSRLRSRRQAPQP